MQLHLAGGTGMKEKHRAAAAGRPDEQALRGGGHDERELVSLFDGRRLERHADHAADLHAIRDALAGPRRFQGRIKGAKPPGGGRGSRGMALLGKAKSAMDAEPHPVADRLKDWPIGGRKRDCAACH